MISGYRITADQAEMDLDAIHAYLASSYWAEGIPFNVVEKAVENSLCFGVLTDAGEQVGLARVVTDYATFGYLCDVYVLEDHRGKGLSKWLMQCVVDHPQLKGIRRKMLATKDAHELYRKFGFVDIQHPELFMEIRIPDVYKTAGD